MESATRYHRKYPQTLQRSAIPSRKERHRRKTFPKGLFQTPKRTLIALLVGITLFADAFANNHAGLVHAAVAVFCAVVTDLLAFRLQKRKLLFPDGGILTGLIVAVVLDTNVPWYLVALTTVIAILSKHLFKIRGKPIFNPAAFGLLLAIEFFSTGQSWWGGMSLLPAWSVILLLIAGYFITQKVNKFPQVFAFLGVYFTLLLLLGIKGLGDAGDALRTPFVNAALFLAFFMVTDPPTSPARYKDQVWFGVIAAVVSVFIFAKFGGLSYLLIGLLTANAWKTWWTSKKQKALKPRMR
jgi:Na+-translocating ferredoxin:NAD+ oxidoreductase RnfD subunit